MTNCSCSLACLLPSRDSSADALALSLPAARRAAPDPSFDDSAWTWFCAHEQGVPVKLLHESLGHVISVELKTGQTYRGKLFEGAHCLSETAAWKWC